MSLASYATTTSTGGRKYQEEDHEYRTDFERDRDRIIYSNAFRRLEYKTQVFINHEGDLFRTRLTHSLEVAQIGRTVAKQLNINCTLVEAICLAHDLGHTPFGHVGQEELNRSVIEHGGSGFEHNLQSLRIVDNLEESYPNFYGLNLTFETRSGILKHCALNIAKKIGDVGQRFLDGKSPSLEAQLANIADELAYNYHDIDDGLRARLISIEDLEQIDLIKTQIDALRLAYPNVEGRRFEKELVRSLTNLTVNNLIANTMNNIRFHNISSKEDVFMAPIIVAYSEDMYHSQRAIKKFLMKHLYRNHAVTQLRFKVANIMRSLFKAYIEDHSLLPDKYQRRIEFDGATRVVADYISGMTDRHAFRQYNKLFTVESI